MARPYILVAPNGARRTHADHPKLPMTLTEITATATACHNAGAQGLHLHVRDAQGRHTLDPGRYRETLAELSLAVPEMELQITTEAAGIFDVPAQLHCLREVVPQWASIAIREVARAPELADQLYGLCAAQNTRVQHILYDQNDVAQLERWQQDGIVRHSQHERLLVLGRYSEGQQSSPDELKRFIPPTPAAGTWMVCAFGAAEHACLHQAAALGADVRVGFENALADAQGTPWADNAASVAALSAKLHGEPA